MNGTATNLASMRLFSTTPSGADGPTTSLIHAKPRLEVAIRPMIRIQTAPPKKRAVARLAAQANVDTKRTAARAFFEKL